VKIIVGLGNPGKEYENTRHNVGFLALDRIVESYKVHKVIKFDFEKKFNAEIAKLKISDQDILLVKPQTFMNLSGEAVKKIIDFYKADPKTDLIVIHDDVDIPLGKFKIASNGSSAGHKGIQSLIDTLGTDSFTRVRIGVGRPENESIKIEDWVLQKLPDAEKEILFGLIEDLIVQGAQYLGM